MQDGDILRELEDGKIKAWEIEKKIWENSGKSDWAGANRRAAMIRLNFLERKLGKRFPEIKKCYIDNSTVKKGKPVIGTEQKIGGSSTPLSMGGPVKIKGEYAEGRYILPIATNEAALVAGLNRGCKVINECGGITTVVTKSAMTRAPAVEMPSIKLAREVCDKIRSKGGLYRKMKKAAESESRVSKMKDIQPFQMGRTVHLRFVFDTGDSMGMNSATKYSANAINVLKSEYHFVKVISLSGNMCTDKKASHVNVLLGRGKSVETEISIPGKLIKRIYGVEPEEIVRLNRLKNLQGSSLAGSISGFNANVSNTLAALFVATGQDCAQLVESASCFTRAEMKKDKLVFGCRFPCMELATVGGGTGFGTAKECLEMLGCSGPGEKPGENAKKLAEIFAAAATAQDLNLLGAEVHGFELAESHMKLARGK